MNFKINRTIILILLSLTWQLNSFSQEYSKGIDTINWEPSVDHDGVPLEITIKWELFNNSGIPNYDIDISIKTVGNFAYAHGDRYYINDNDKAVALIELIDTVKFISTITTSFEGQVLNTLKYQEEK